MKKLFFLVFVLLFLTCCSKSNVDNDNSSLLSNPESESILEQSSVPRDLASSQDVPSTAQDDIEEDDSPVGYIYMIYIYQPETCNYKAELVKENMSMREAFDKVTEYLGLDPEVHSFSLMQTESGNVDKYWPVIDLDGDFIDRELSDAVAEERFLNSVCATVRDQYSVSRTTTFLRDGGPYRSAHLSMEADEAYLYRAISVGALGSEKYAQLRAMIPYQGLSEVYLLFRGEGVEYIIDPPGERGKEFVEFLTQAYSNIEYDSPKDIPDSDLIYIGIRSAGLYTASKDSPLWAIAESVNDDQFAIKEHIEAAISEIFGECPDINHHDINYWRWLWHENEGVYTPPHIGGGWPQQAVILESKEYDDRYVLTIVYIDTANYGIETEAEKQAYLEKLRNEVRNEAQTYEVVLLKQPDGRVTMFSQHRL